MQQTYVCCVKPIAFGRYDDCVISVETADGRFNEERSPGPCSEEGPLLGANRHFALLQISTAHSTNVECKSL